MAENTQKSGSQTSYLRRYSPQFTLLSSYIILGGRTSAPNKINTLDRSKPNESDSELGMVFWVMDLLNWFVNLHLLVCELCNVMKWLNWIQYYVMYWLFNQLIIVIHCLLNYQMKISEFNAMRDKIIYYNQLFIIPYNKIYKHLINCNDNQQNIL